MTSLTTSAYNHLADANCRLYEAIIKLKSSKTRYQTKRDLLSETSSIEIQIDKLNRQLETLKDLDN